MRYRCISVLTQLLTLFLIFPCTQASAQSDEPIRPIPLEVKLDPAKVALGERLFNDPRLSKDNSVSCSSCHVLAKGGMDNRKTSIGVGGAQGVINAPSVFNASFNFRQFWDGRAASLEEQTTGPVNNPLEMASSWPDVVHKLSNDPSVKAQFKAVYHEEIQVKDVQDALASYERSLTTPNARFDKYLRGDKNALSASEIKGYGLFKSYGCVACHQGINVGGNMFQTFGVMGDYFAARGNQTPADNGRFNVTNIEGDRHVFKVPSLRNVAMTAPYFHDGSAKTLDEAVNIMFKYQLGRQASESDRQLIVSFLKTLTGEYQGKPLAPTIATVASANE